MIRIILFLLAIALAAAGAAWVADQTGEATLTWGGWRVQTSLPVFALALGVAVVVGMLLWSILSGVLRAPGRVQRVRRDRRHARGRHAITHGLLAIGHGDSAAARQHATTARRLAGSDPLALLLHAQSAQLDGDREGAKAAFRAMAEREDTRLLGLRGLFIEAQRADDAVAAVMIADEALKIAPSSTWASHAVLGFRCSKGDWNGALAILGNNLDAGLIDKTTYRRHRGVLLTARALELEHLDRDVARESVMEAVKLAPTLVPAAVLAAKFESEAHQVRRAMRIAETAWLAEPHPDLADAYAHVRLGDSARQRLVRIETLAAKMPGHIEGALALARAAIDAAEFGRAREALKPFIEQPTQRVAMLMSELERTEHGDSGRARAWTLRAVRARHDSVWTADGYVSDRWRPVSPVTGRIDAFRWQTPVAALPSDKGPAIDISPFEEAMLAAPVPPRQPLPAREALAEPAREIPVEAVPPEPAAQDNSPAEVKSAPEAKPAEPPAPAVVAAPAAAPAPPTPIAPPAPVPAPAVIVAVPPAPVVAAAPAPPPSAPPAAQPPAAPSSAAEPTVPPPLFRSRADLARSGHSPIPAIIPLVRAPDDPGIDDEAATVDEFAEQIGTSKVQAGGWRGFWSRLGD
jgi:HemY protein